jgi:HPt (histidine-containing phosphotransfer) domain-containing protein
MPRFDRSLPSPDLDPAQTARELAHRARDAAYVAIGAGVLGFQRLQVQRRELEARLAEPSGGAHDRLAAVRGDLTAVLTAVDQQVESLIEQVEAALSPLEERLPEPARDLAAQVHERARDARAQLRGRLGSTA